MRGKTMLKKSAGFLVAIAGSFMLPLSAFAADVPSVNLYLQETRKEAGEVWDAEPALSNMNCEIEDYEWDYDRDSWKPGRKVLLTVTVTATEGNDFTKNTMVFVSNGEKSTAAKKGNRYVVKINYTPKVMLAQPTGIRYEDETTLCWESVEYAGGYEIQIKKDGNFYKTISVDGKNTEEYDLSEYITDDYTYTCSIRAVAPQGKYASITSSDWVNFDEDGVSMSGTSMVSGEFVGTGNYKRFLENTGSYVQGWQYINDTWYYFDPENYSYAVAGKQAQINGNLYSFDENGRMVVGWKQESDGRWYYYSMDTQGQQPFGAAKTGWIQSAPESPWYYLNDGSVAEYPKGAMLTNTTTPDGYYVNENGEWI